jgi:hypothetical protein
MVGVINPTHGSSIEKQQQAAINATLQLLPGEPWPAEGSVPGSETAVISLSSSPAASVKDPHQLSDGAIAGIAIGALFLILLAAALFFFLGRSKTYKDIIHRQSVGNVTHSADNIRSQCPETRDTVTSHYLSPTTTQGHGPWSPVREIQHQRPQMNEFQGLSLDEKPLPPPGHPIFGHFRNAPIELSGESRQVGEMPVNGKL